MRMGIVLRGDCGELGRLAIGCAIDTIGMPVYAIRGAIGLSIIWAHLEAALRPILAPNETLFTVLRWSVGLENFCSSWAGRLTGEKNDSSPGAFK